MLAEYNLNWQKEMSIKDLLLIKDKPEPNTISSLPLKSYAYLNHEIPSNTGYGFDTTKRCHSFIKQSQKVVIELPNVKYLTEYLDMLEEHFFCEFTRELVTDKTNDDYWIITIASQDTLKNYYNFVMIRMFYSHIYMFIVDRLLYHYINIDKSIEPDAKLTVDLWEIFLLMTKETETFGAIFNGHFSFFKKTSSKVLRTLLDTLYNFEWCYYFGVFEKDLRSNHFFILNFKDNTFSVSLDALQNIFKHDFSKTFVNLHAAFSIKSLITNGVLISEKTNNRFYQTLREKAKTSKVAYLLTLVSNLNYLSIVDLNGGTIENIGYFVIKKTVLSNDITNKDFYEYSIKIYPNNQNHYLKRTSTLKLKFYV
jgi:hypothetical protein